MGIINLISMKTSFAVLAALLGLTTSEV